MSSVDPPLGGPPSAAATAAEQPSDVDGVGVWLARRSDRGMVILPDQGADGAADLLADGLVELTQRLLASDISTVVVDGGRTWWATSGPTPGWFADSLRPWLSTHGIRACGLLGVGVGGQAALSNAYRRGDQWVLVAAVAPACDLGRWYGQGTGLDDEFADADAARQAEAPLFYNPLSSPRAQLVWCDPRDAACQPSAVRVVSKVQSSGGRIDSDLQTQAGTDRDSYVGGRAGELSAWVAAALDRAATRPPLRVLS